MIGKYVIVRSGQSGCWGGVLAGREGSEVELLNARRLWRWWAAEGVSLSGVAAAGLDKVHISECRIAAPVERALVLDCCEVLLASSVARDSIESAEVLRD